MNTVLLVDDEEHVLSALRRVLADEPYEVLCAASGDEALNLLDSTPCKVVVTDERMIGTSYKESEILAAARVDGMRSLLEDGLEKVRQGLTTMDEILRVVGPAVRMERHCDHCGKLMESRHLFCPHCGAFRQNCCRSCHRALEDDWLICPECGTARQ